MSKYNVGQTVTCQKDYTVTDLEKDYLIKKGTKAIVTNIPSLRLANGKEIFIHRSEIDIVGFSANGIAHHLFSRLKAFYPSIGDFLEDNEIPQNDFESTIAYVLQSELGLCEGNTKEDK